MPTLIPRTFEDPVGLARRLLQSRDRDAYFAMGLAATAIVTAPLDLLLARAERRRYARASEPRQPIILVAGAPRSGTTVVSQVLLQHLPVAYLSNLTDLFPRAPITARRLFGRFVRRPAPTYHSFYGRTWGLGGTNDGLKIWDRWWGPSRYVVPEHFDAATAAAMRRFFGAYEAAFGRPLLNKNNALATCATLVARTLPTAHIIFVVREALYNAQSILVAREKIQGSRQIGYGVQDPTHRSSGDPFEDVCVQVLYHHQKVETQQREVGAARLWVVRYEDVCREPYRLVERVADEVLRIPCDLERLRTQLAPLKATNRATLPPAEFEYLERTLARVGAARVPPDQPCT